MNLILKSTSSDFVLPDIGVIIKSGGGSDFSGIPELVRVLGQSSNLRARVIAGTVVVNNGSVDLAALAGQQYLNQMWLQAGSDIAVAMGQVEGTISDNQHGARAGGTNHPVVTGSVNGYMSSADKTKLDGVFAGNPSVVTGTGELTTSATSYTPLSTPMSVTPGAGTYLCRFSTAAGNSKNSNQTFISLFANAVQVVESQRRTIGQASNRTGVCSEALITVGAGEAIDVRWYVDSGSVGSMLNRTLVVQRTS